MAKIIFSVGSKMFETNQQGQSSRQILNNDDLIISSFDFNYDKKIFYLADDKNNKVLEIILFIYFFCYENFFFVSRFSKQLMDQMVN